MKLKPFLCPTKYWGGAFSPACHPPLQFTPTIYPIDVSVKCSLSNAVVK
jgi:hypothetical protein